MARDTLIMRAVEFDKLPAKFKKQYANVQALVDAGWWVQPKYDGCFGMAVIRANGKHAMLSREGNDYTPSCAHILEELYEAACVSYETPWNDFIVLGEVWLPNTPFPAISGMFRRRAASALQFVVHDCVSVHLDTTETYAERLAGLRALVAPSAYEKNVWVAATYQSGFMQQPVQDYAAELVKRGGFDGAIVKDPKAGYTVGLVKRGEIVKVKPTLSLDLECCRVITEVGEKTGRDVYTLEVVYQGVKSMVGSGVPHEYSEDWLAYPVEIECMGLTEEGKLREPRFKGIRYDKVVPDA